jgi:hypothetical protein
MGVSSGNLGQGFSLFGSFSFIWHYIISIFIFLFSVNPFSSRFMLARRDPVAKMVARCNQSSFYFSIHVDHLNQNPAERETDAHKDII